MSITFDFVGSPRTTITYSCDLCEGRGCPGCHEGEISYSEGKYSLNVSNANAFALLPLMGLKPSHMGEVAVEDLPAVRRALLLARNKASARRPACASGSTSRGQRGAVLVRTGRSDEYLLQRIDQLTELVVHAQEAAAPLYWG